MAEEGRIRSVAIIGAGAAGKSPFLARSGEVDGTHVFVVGAITAAAFAAEKYFDRIQVFERRESAGGTWYFESSSL
jgi:cation diffusion facilitator CzcD-associated flavoprotein CzcO